MARTLTQAQRRFLADYLPDILDGENADLARAGREEFVRRVAKMDFDGVADRAAGRVAKHLQGRGLLGVLEIHKDGAGQQCIYVQFSASGAAALFDIHAKGQ
ncbi:hypothetical protein [Ralstonia pseudosolanacearum]|uniref:hypothetical protein n=1 Tax=Ralstonia pseudosolanacearum TaxID=1310165 RepID=UPI003CEBDE33